MSTIETMRVSDSIRASAPPTALVLTGLAAVAVGALLLFAAPARPPAGREPLSPLAAQVLGPLAYRLPVLVHEDPDQTIAFYFQKAQTDTGGMTRALLAASYLAKARLGGGPHWYLLADGAARESLAALPFENERAELVLARVAEARHDFAQAIAMARRVMAKKARHPEAIGVLYACALARGRLPEALEHASALLAQEPAAATCALRAAVYLAQGRDARAGADLRHALALEEVGELEASARARTLLGRLAQRRGETLLAGALYREALRLQPRFAPALVARAELELATGRQLGSEVDLLAADALAPLPGLRVLAARVLARRAPAEAAALGERTERDLRRDLGVGGMGHRRDLAALLCDRGTPAAYAEAAALMEAEAGVRRDAVTLELLARTRLATGRAADAEAAIAEALAPPPDAAGEEIRHEPWLLVTGAHVAQVLGRPDLARARLSEALAGGAPFPERAAAARAVAAP